MESGSVITPMLHFGPLTVSVTVITTWGIMLVLGAVCYLSTRRLELVPGRWQVVVEGVVTAIQDTVCAMLGKASAPVLPFVGTLWIFIVCANLAGVIPGVRGPTDDLSLTAGLALLVFVSVHWYGIHAHGWKGYLGRYLRPNPLLLPFHLMSEVSRTVALALRLFGNIFSLEMAAMLVLLVGGLLVPIPVLALHIVEALVQAYIFGMLALIYIASGIQAQQLSLSKE
ncbi:MAG: F0F1 ATP synthase subunit A [Betaproteobacteria bacterium]|nr:F0F1 ATP synthase subunit A [Gammaproteobacteria bacterium]MDH3435965.1 F0F1 ATP synthase subunit A [Betaproteobacteria bacterium]